ncbi:MAG: Holliday junction resolvase Hjc [Candidatus Woesearchaeota archaeon]
MSLKSKGISAERELIHLLWEKEYACARVAGSGSNRYPSCDIIAGKPGHLLVFECKSIKGTTRYIDKKDMEDFLSFARSLGATPWIAVRFSKMLWHFISPEDTIVTPKAYGVSRILVQQKGLLLEEIIRM